MSSPFVYETPVGRADLVARGSELKELVGRAVEGRNTRLEGPRRFGKTSLVAAALEDARTEGLIAISVNFLGVLTVDDVASRIERAYAEQLDGPLRRWFTGVVRTLGPTVSAAPGGVRVKLAPAPKAGALLDRLALPRRLAEKRAERCLVAFDEFQEVVRVGAHVPGIFRSELEQHGGVASYIFSGSHPGLMRDLFADRRHAFFAQAAPMAVGLLPSDALADFVVRRFTEHRRDPGEALGPLLDLAAGHPQRAMLLAHHLYEQTSPRRPGDLDAWDRASACALAEAGSEIAVAWGAFSNTRRRVIAVIAARDVKLNSHTATERFGLARTGANQGSVDALADDGHIVSDPETATGWRVVDPFLVRWITTGG